jgi:hypothetical protein
LCAGALSTGGAGLEPIENVKYASGSSRRPLQNGRLGFSLSTQTHDDIAFAVNPLSPPHLGYIIRYVSIFI